ncbi:hypothetical protein QLQ09_00760 [Brucella sp. NM4]|uniref:hypothetical protein n=1 Tax=Brucella/Ochrobactrum group TaxID=2826938 RepID=UPI0024BCDE48|nr:hypothetical protein [Brucella sp. NM4]WHS30152.1 hypothetical protein QLQ09_00760 [Brucella sp. NM4]WHT44364.1 hypothetical protein QLQ11_21280 [Ochrobactrum sp. SSR]
MRVTRFAPNAGNGNLGSPFWTSHQDSFTMPWTMNMQQRPVLLINRIAVPIISLLCMGLLISYMQLEHDHERIDRETVLLTNHWTGEVRRCHRSYNSELSCQPTTLQPRLWYLSLSSFDSPAAKAAKQGDKSTPLSDLIFYGAFGLAILIIFILPMLDRSTEQDSRSSRKSGDASD